MGLLGVLLFLDRGRTAGGPDGRPSWLLSSFMERKEGFRLGSAARSGRPAGGPRSGREAASKLQKVLLFVGIRPVFAKNHWFLAIFRGLDGIPSTLWVLSFWKLLKSWGPIWAYNRPSGGYGWLPVVFLCISGTTNVHFELKTLVFDVFSMSFLDFQRPGSKNPRKMKENG